MSAAPTTKPKDVLVPATAFSSTAPRVTALTPNVHISVMERDARELCLQSLWEPAARIDGTWVIPQTAAANLMEWRLAIGPIARHPSQQPRAA